MKEDEIQKAYVYAQWYEKLRETNNEIFMPLFACESRYLVLKGGGGSGKSIFAGRKILERAAAEENHRFLVCRKVARTLRESCAAQLMRQIGQFYPDRLLRQNKTDLTITFKNGSEILFAGLDDVEKLKSIYNITGIWIEEASELLESDFNQLDIRLRGKTKYYKQIILTFNPVSVSHWLKKRFFDKKDTRATVCESTYRDNRFLDDAAKKTLEDFRFSDPYYYTVYCLGLWGTTGQTVFDAKAVTRRLSEAIKPKRTGYFTYTDDGRQLTNQKFWDSTDGFIHIFSPPEKGVPYVIGCDTAGTGGDWFVAQVLDNRTGRQVCMMRHKADEDVFAKQVYCLGLYYNTALIGIETNFSTYPIRELERLRYPRQYVRETEDDFTHTLQNAYGVWTGAKTRPVMIAALVQAVREDVCIVSDTVTLSEMLTFVRDEHFRPQAEPGAHDDCVMALAIAHYIRPQQSFLKEETKKTCTWTPSMWEDYEKANKEEKAYLRKKWGTPTRR